ncbi:MAG: preprotein translocase subunit YajC [Acetobacteraceae bacterium]|nr:preprotein translocase subunit YajC [Acetobacteraceae bacterium]
MLISPAYAQDLGGFVASAGQFLPILLIFAVFYFLLIRPQQQQAKKLKAKLAALKRNDRVLTGGGIVGVVQKTTEGSNEIEVEIAPNVRVKVLRETITSVLGDPKPANDSKVVQKG